MPKFAFILVSLFSLLVFAEDQAPSVASSETTSHTKVVYPKNTKLDFDGISLEGELKNPAEFYFKYRPQEEFKSLVQKRKNFHREMLRDAVQSK